ncbi:voltage-gated potassium channel subunit beta-2 isoform X2 [Daktulosphaira vitifoliae]|uniref:voltage-gated potassium channel subunit beta-2 isoform X2 n=1 Tax=Daktulosphaira vitifoliae TaxID=58002 RepID=UPI0021AA2111|nr:voltage-gated potassium channel subunit beta-2 isoform X2 [Daktulosphaira vitifoliae]
MAEAAARHELYTQQQWAHQRAERAERNAERLEREIQAQAASAAASESLAELHYADSLSGSVQSICKAPIASLDCMADLGSTTEQLCAKLQAANSKDSADRVCSTLSPSQTSGLRYRNLGKSGLRVSNIGLATWTTFNTTTNEEQLDAVVTAAYNAGINLFDLTEGPQNSEQAEIQLGNILKKKNWKRVSYSVITKIHWQYKSEERGLSRKHIIESVRSSVARLRLDYVDIVLIQKADPMCPLEEVVRAMDFLVSEGLIMYWGTARWSPIDITEMYTACRQLNCATPILEQAEYHMLCREKVEIYMPELYNKIGVGLMAWSPMAMGLMPSLKESLRYRANAANRAKSLSISWSQDDRKPSNKESVSSRSTKEILCSISLIAERLGCSLVQLSIAWTLKNESVQCLLLGAATTHQFYHALHGLQLLPKLNANVMAELERILDNKPVRPPMVSTLAMR